MSESPSARDERLARNEALFRDVNEQIAQLANGSDSSDALRIICECSNIGCEKTLLVPRNAYQRVRANPARFLVAPSHINPSIEAEVEAHGTWVTVEKHAELAAELT